MQGDDLSILLFWATLAVSFGYEAVKAETKLRRIGLGSLASIFLLCGVFWLQIKQIWPPLTEAIAAIATSPQSWFVLFIFIAAIVIFGRPKRAIINNVRRGNEATAEEIEQLKGRMNAFEGAGGQDESALRQMTEIAAKLDRLEKNVVKNNGRIHEYERYHVNTMDGLIEQFTHSLLFDSVPKLPAICSLRELTPEALAAETQKASNYWKETRSLMSATKWASDLRYIEQDAKNTGDRAIRDIPVSERPVGVDPQDLARFAEIKYRAETCSEFLENAKLESSTTYRSILSRMRELYQEANSRKSN